MENQLEIADTTIREISEHLEVINTLKELVPKIELIAKRIIKSLERGGKLLICGNGGSAADAQHLSSELVGRYQKERKSLCAISLSTDPSIVTAISNDYGFNKVFSRQIEGLGTSEDILLVISTSGQSQNLINAIKSANKQEMETVGLLGNQGGVIKNMLNLSIVINSKNTARIQECHGLIIHLICKIVDINMANS